MVRSKKTVARNKKNEILENPEALADRLTKTEQFFEKNRKITLIAATTIAVIIGGYFGFRYFIQTQDKKAQVEMFQAIYYFEQDSLDKALNGDLGGSLGFTEIIDTYKFTKAANLANFYAGSIYLKKGKFEEAIDHLKDFSSSDLLVQGRAYCLIGDANMELGDFGEAVNYYKKASDYKENKYYTPKYLMKLALAYELEKDYEGAISAYDKIIEEFQDAQEEYPEAKKQKARLESLNK